jgi:hypothetical protein
VKSAYKVGLMQGWKIAGPARQQGKSVANRLSDDFMSREGGLAEFKVDRTDGQQNGRAARP